MSDMGARPHAARCACGQHRQSVNDY